MRIQALVSALRFTNLGAIVALGVVGLLVAAGPVAAEEETGGPFVSVTSKDLVDFGDDLDGVRGTFYNPTGIVVGGELYLYVQGGLSRSLASSECWNHCDLDTIVRFEAPFTASGVRGPFEPGNRVSPCRGDELPELVHYGVGSVLRSSFDNQYKLFLDRTEGGADFSKGHFKEILIGTSSDAVDFTYPEEVNPFIRQCNGISIIDVTLIDDGSMWWGTFQFGTSQPNQTGFMRVLDAPSNPRGFEVQILSGGTFKTVDDDGTFDFTPDNIWSNSGANSIVLDGGQYELWGSVGGGSGVTEGCEDPNAGSKKIVYRTIDSSGNLGPVQDISSRVRAMPSINGTGRLFPFRINRSGEKLLFTSTSDDVCFNNQPSNWGSNVFVGHDTVMTVLDGTPDQNAIGEVGSVTVTHTPTSVSFGRAYDDPVVIARPPTRNGSHTSVVRIENVSSSGFDLFIDEAPNRDGAHTTETVHYLVLESGSWQLHDRRHLEVGKVTTSRTVGPGVSNQWQSVSFPNAFETTPAVLTQVQTDNDATWVKTRQRNASVSSFQVALEQADSVGSPHGTETVGWVAVHPGQGNSNGHPYQVLDTANAVTHNPFTVDFQAAREGFSTLGADPHWVGALATYDGGDGAALRQENLASTSVDVRVEEDSTLDSEINHTTEVVSYFALGGDGAVTGVPYPGPTDLPPDANFSVSCSGLTCTFQARTGGASSYFWEFGDNSTGTGQTAVHTYASEGDYRPRLTTTDAAGQSCTAIEEKRATSGACDPDETTFCAQNSRFEITAEIGGQALRAERYSDAGGFFWSDDSDRPDVAVKVIDGTPINGRYWVFHGSLTEDSYQVTVTDKVKGTTRSYTNDSADSLCGGADTGTFTQSAVIGEAAAGAVRVPRGTAPAEPTRLAPKSSTCTDGATALCLLDHRFRVRVLQSGTPRNGARVSEDTGAFWFGSAGNPEVVVEMLEGDSNHYWLIFGSLTSQSYTVEVTDTVGGGTNTYPDRAAHCGTIDKQAFAK